MFGSGFFLFGIIELPVEKASAGADEPEARVRPPGDLLRQPGEMDHRERHRRQRLDDEVPVARGVERVRGDAVEAELARDHGAIDRVAGARERGRAQRQPVDAPAAVAEALDVALDPAAHRPRRTPPLWDGHAGERIADVILDWLDAR